MDNLMVYAEPDTTIISNLNSLHRVTDGVSISDNTLNTHVDLENPGLVFFSIPYDEGWSIYVNGEKSQVYTANKAFMAIPLISGEYDITLHYFPVHYARGLSISAASLIILLIYYFINKKRIVKA